MAGKEIDELFGKLELYDKNKKWFVVYTRVRHEKKVAEQCIKNRVSYYLPLKDSVRRYKYREIVFRKPLFPGYIFCYCNLDEKRKLINSPPLTKFLDVFDQQGLLHSLKQIHKVKEGKGELIPHKYLTRGRKVRIKDGVFTGIEGRISKRKGLYRIVLNINVIKQAVSLEVDIKDIEVL